MTDSVSQAAEREIASRVLSRRRFLPFVQRINPRYTAGWVHEDIAKRLEKFSDDVAKGLSPRLMILMPPRAGKSELASKTFPAWHLGRHPDHEMIACSYNLDLAMDFSKKIKTVIDSDAYQQVFDARLDPDNRSSASWGIHKDIGGYVAAGIGGGINGKGAHCLPPETLINTEIGNISIEQLYLSKCRPRVYSYDTDRKIVVLRNVAAFSTRMSSEMYEIVTQNGASLTLTGDHPIYLPDTDEFVRADHLEALYGTPKNAYTPNVCTMLKSVPEGSVQPQQVLKAKLPRVLLLDRVQQAAPCIKAQETLRSMPSAHRHQWSVQEREVLFGHLPGIGETRTQKDRMSTVWRLVCAIKSSYGLLLERLCGCRSLRQDVGGRELPLQRWQKLLQVVRRDEAINHGARQVLCGMQRGEEATHASCESRPIGQQSRQSDRALRDPSHDSPQVQYDTLAVVRRVGGGAITVYDLEVEETHNFFAEGICVHNCLIIDDPIKNAEEADSATVREGIWDWFGSVAYTRLAPGGGVLCIQTWWHDDDLAGRLMSAMKSGNDDVDQYDIVKYPAIAEFDEYIDPETDKIERLSPNETPGEGLRLLRKVGEALHPERFPISALKRIRATLPKRFWSALYQQNPVPDDGSFFTKDMFKRDSLPDRRYCNVSISWDFAIGIKKKNDFTVGTVTLQDSDDVIHVAEVLRFKSNDLDFIVDSILTLAKRWYHPSLIIGFEDGHIYKTLTSTLKKAMQKERFYPSTRVLPPLTDKEVRATPLQGRMQQGMVSFNAVGEWYDVIHAEMLRFPSGIHDDTVDSLAWNVQMVLDREPPKPPREEKAKSWKDRFKSSARGASHMSS